MAPNLSSHNAHITFRRILLNGGIVVAILGIFATVTHLASATWIEREYRDDDGAKIAAHDFTIGGSALSTTLRDPYLQSSQFQNLLRDKCRYVIIVPFVNDLTFKPEIALDQEVHLHLSALTKLTGMILQANRYRQIVLIDFYHGTAQPFSNSYASGVNTSTIDAFNQAIMADCVSGRLSNPQVVCVDADSIFAAAHISPVGGLTEQPDVLYDAVTAVKPDRDKGFDYYFRINPGGHVLADGVHMSVAGRQALGAYLAHALAKIKLSHVPIRDGFPLVF